MKHLKNDIHVIQKPVKTSLFICLCILRDLLQQKIPREFCGGGAPSIFLHSHVLMKRFFDGQIRKIKKNKKETMEERKRRDFVMDLEVPTLVCSPSVGNGLRLLPSYDPPSGQPTHMGTSPTSKKLLC
jgi:hypothetical protein